MIQNKTYNNYKKKKSKDKTKKKKRKKKRKREIFLVPIILFFCISLTGYYWRAMSPRGIP
jgi:hypothetical protein